MKTGDPEAWNAAWMAAATWADAADDLPRGTDGKEEAERKAKEAKAEAEEKAERKAKEAAYKKALSTYQEKRDSPSGPEEWNDVAKAALDMQAAAADLPDDKRVAAVEFAEKAKAEAKAELKEAKEEAERTWPQYFVLEGTASGKGVCSDGDSEARPTISSLVYHLAERCDARVDSNHGQNLVRSQDKNGCDKLNIKLFFDNEDCRDTFEQHLSLALHNLELFTGGRFTVQRRTVEKLCATEFLLHFNYTPNSTSPKQEYLTLDIIAKYGVPFSPHMQQLRSDGKSYQSSERSAGSDVSLDQTGNVAKAQFIDVPRQPLKYQRCHLKDKAECDRGGLIDSKNESNMVAMSVELHCMFDGRNLDESFPIVMPFAVEDPLARTNGQWPDRRRVFFGLGTTDREMSDLAGVCWREDAIWDTERDVVWTAIYVLDPKVAVEGTMWKMESTRTRMDTKRKDMGSNLAKKLEASSEWLARTHLTETDGMTPTKERQVHSLFPQ